MTFPERLEDNLTQHLLTLEPHKVYMDVTTLLDKRVISLYLPFNTVSKNERL
jgi:hypothetical protein